MLFLESLAGGVLNLSVAVSRRSERVKKDVLDRRRTFEDIEAHSKALASRT